MFALSDHLNEGRLLVVYGGFVYRIDMRLRPFGDSGALTASFAALEQYYQLHGRDYGEGFWRQQWLGLKRLAGRA